MATSGAENYATIGAILKEIVADGVANLNPAHVILGKLSPLKQLEPEGLKFVVPTMVKRPQGFSFTRGGTGPSALNPARAGKIERAEVQSNNVFLVDVLDKEMIDRTQEKGGVNEGKYGKAAVKKATAVVIPALLEAAKIEDEAGLLYGQSDRGQIAALADITSGATTSVFTITKATFAPGLWIGQAGAPIDVFDSAATPVFLGTWNIVDVNPETHIATVEGPMTSAAITAATFPLKVYRNGTRLAATAAASYYDSIGLEAIFRNTSILFNIDGAVYALWKTYLHNIGGAADIGDFMTMSAIASVRGAGNDFTFFIPTGTWVDLATAEIANRRYLGPKGTTQTLTVGPDAIEVIGATGRMALKPHPMIKRSLCMGLNLGDSEAGAESVGGDFIRIGTTDWKFDTTGSGDILHYLPGVSGYEMRLASNKALFVNSPGRQIMGYGIVDGQGA